MSGKSKLTADDLSRAGWATVISPQRAPNAPGERRYARPVAALVRKKIAIFKSAAREEGESVLVEPFMLRRAK